MNVFDVAMKMEMDGKAYYEKLAGQTDLPGLQTIFRQLAEDEQKHYELFKAMKERNDLPDLKGVASLSATRNVFKSMPRPERALKQIKETLAAYQHAMDVEAESQRYYEQAAGEEADPQIKAALLRIAAEEKRHFEIMESVYDFTNEPNQFLSGAEISNLEKP